MNEIVRPTGRAAGDGFLRVRCVVPVALAEPARPVPPMRRAAVGVAWALAWTLAWGGAILGFAHKVHAEPKTAAAVVQAAALAR